MTRVQVAGISSLADALACERAGADAIGFTVGLPGGPHNGLDEAGAAAIIRGLPPLITPVLITYRVTAAEVVPMCRQIGVLAVQLHAPADPKEIASMRAALPGLKVILSVNVTGPDAVAVATERARHADTIILDTYDPTTGQHGATGKTHDWSISRRVVEALGVPVILAGGLTPENVAEAIRTVRPWGVDVHTGVERPDGSTDHERVRAFVAAAKRVRLDVDTEVTKAMIETLNGETRLFPIIGDPITYVRSPQRLTSGFTTRGRNGICIPMEVPEAALEGVMRGLSLTPNVDGLLITMPHKFKAFSYCATSSQTSRLFGVVSVMRRNADGSWHGDMLDGFAFVKAQKDQGAQPKGARVLLVGAGGAGSAIALALLEAGVRELIVHDTDRVRTSHLIDLLGGIARDRMRAGPPDPTGCDMVCNASPMGMADGDPLPVDTRLLSPSMFVGDVIAGHGVTPFLKAAQAVGCRTADGDQMVEAVQEMMLDFMLTRSRSAGGGSAAP